MYPVLFTIPLPWGGHLPVFSYGTCIAVGFLVSYAYTCWRARQAGQDEEIITDIFLVIIVTSIVGARSNYVLTHWADYTPDPMSMFRVWQGGMVFLGGFIGALVGAYGYLRYRGLSFGLFADMFAPAVAFAAGLGRVGCMLNGCCYGIATTSWCAWDFSNGGRGPAQPRHPTQLYELIILWSISLYLHRFYSRNKVHGAVMVRFGMIYAFERFMIEFIRDESLTERYILGTTLAQSTCMGIMAISLIWAYVLRRGAAPPPTP